MADKNRDLRPKREATKKEVEKAEKKLKEAIRGSHEVLITATTVFPFTIFPDTVTIDRAKLTITRRTFFSVAEVRSIRLEDILDVTAHVGPVFGSLHIISRGINPEKPFDVRYLWRDEAMKIKHIMQGYTIVSTMDNVDLNALSTDELTNMLDRVGREET